MLNQLVLATSVLVVVMIVYWFFRACWEFIKDWLPTSEVSSTSPAHTELAEPNDQDP